MRVKLVHVACIHQYKLNVARVWHTHHATPTDRGHSFLYGDQVFNCVGTLPVLYSAYGYKVPLKAPSEDLLFGWASQDTQTGHYMHFRLSGLGFCPHKLDKGTHMDGTERICPQRDNFQGHYTVNLPDED